MSNIYVGQYSLRIKLTCGQEITSAASLGIGYKKPDGTIGRWSGTSSDDATGEIYYDLESSSNLDQAGLWHFWAYVEFSDNREANGDIVTQIVTVVGNPVS